MKFHMDTTPATAALTFFEVWQKQNVTPITLKSLDDQLLNYVKDALDPIEQSIGVLHQTAIESNMNLENKDRKLIKGGVKSCLEKNLEECFAFYKEGIKQLFLRDSFNLIQGFISSEQNKIINTNNHSESVIPTDDIDINVAYNTIKTSELVTTWDLFEEFLENSVSKNEMIVHPNLLNDFDIEKLNMDYFVLDANTFIDWENSKKTWKSKSLLLIQNYLKILEEPTSLIKNIESAYDIEEEDEDLEIGDGKVSLQCKFTLQDYVKPMISSCKHTFDDKALKMKAEENRSFKCLEGACKANLTYPKSFKVDELMVFRMGCSKLVPKK
ncbi:hypothetical protein QEN19_003375 [Hanseniaspora menglaensis]